LVHAALPIDPATTHTSRARTGRCGVGALRVIGVGVGVVARVHA